MNQLPRALREGLRFAAVGVLSAVLAACGGGGGGQTNADAALETAAAPPPPPRAPVEPLGVVGVPDVNTIGLLDGEGVPGGIRSAQWSANPITKPNQRTDLQRLGKALFWDMQVGGDGIQACASCHFQAGADHRVTNQISPGLKGNDFAADVIALNGKLGRVHYSGTANGLANAGFAVSEAALLAGGASVDGPLGEPGGLATTKPVASADVNDVASSQGVRGGKHLGVSANRVDAATLSASDPGFDFSFTSNAVGVPDTVRRVEPRNSPTVINAVYNLRNFWDGRADAFFNGVNPLGARDPDARVKVYGAGGLGTERLDIPLSSLASQAVGPIESDFEMVFSVDPAQPKLGGRAHRELGKKLARPGAVPLAGQDVATTDSLLGGLARAPGLDGARRGLTATYDGWIRSIFQERFWGDGNGNDVCLNADGSSAGTATPGQCASAYTLMQWNFSLFFGLAVQAYEATLVTTNTIVDLIAGGIATGTITNGRRTVAVDGLALEGCIALVSINNSAAQQAVGTNLCTTHYAKFIQAGATTGTESATAPFPVPNGALIGGQCGTGNTTAPNDAPGCVRARNTLLNVDRGLGRFFAGATACSVCHFNPEFTGATVSTLTGFGAQLPALPPGQLRRELERRVMMERMPIFNGAVAVYDAGFYNIGVRPTPEDVSLGAQIGGVPLSLSKLFEVAAGGDATGLDAGKINAVATKLGSLVIPTSPTDLTPMPFPTTVACGPGLIGNGNANNNPDPRCVPNMVAGERLLRNGAFKASGLRNVKFTGPYMHNGSKMNIRQVLEFYKTAGHFTVLNNQNLDAGMRTFNLGAADESAVVELIETGLTDWRVAYQRGPFDHPELCVPHGHNATNGRTQLVGLPAVGVLGSAHPIPTFEEQLDISNGPGIVPPRANDLRQACTMPGLVAAGSTGEADSLIDVPPILAP